MKDFLKANGLCISLFVMIVAFIYVGGLDRERNAKIRGINHIAIVTATDRNCNDCHFGESFVNLFNHNAVKSNDNVVTLMMDRAKIKRW